MALLKPPREKEDFRDKAIIPEYEDDLTYDSKTKKVSVIKKIKYWVTRKVNKYRYRTIKGKRKRYTVKQKVRVRKTRIRERKEKSIFNKRTYEEIDKDKILKGNRLVKVNTSNRIKRASVIYRKTRIPKGKYTSYSTLYFYVFDLYGDIVVFHRKFKNKGYVNPKNMVSLLDKRIQVIKKGFKRFNREHNTNLEFISPKELTVYYKLLKNKKR